jgi:tetratricopeptide (TPR) repeat protein
LAHWGNPLWRPKDMSRTCSVILVTITLISHVVFGILPNDIVFTPSAEFEQVGHTEFGYQTLYNPQTAISEDKGLYFQYSFSNKLRYGLEYMTIDNTKDIYHHFAYKIGSIFKQSQSELALSGSVNYLSQTTPRIKYERVNDGSLTLSWIPHLWPINLHYTLARELSTQDFIHIGAISYVEEWGKLAFEWDGTFMNMSSQILVNERINIRGGITKKISNESELLFKTAIGFVDLNIPGLEQAKMKKVEKKKETVKTNIGLQHIQEGLDAYYKGDYKSALKSYEIAQKLLPESAIVYERLGSIHYKLGNNDSATFAWEKANIIAPSDRLKTFIKSASQKSESRYK